MEFDQDLQARQEVRRLVSQAELATKQLATWSQETIDRLVEGMANAAYDHAQELSELACLETGFGNVASKVMKNQFASKTVGNAVKSLKTVGILRKNQEEQVWDVGVPVGVICGIVPSTNPTSTVIYKAIIALKGGNAIVFSPHPAALKSTLRAVEILAKAAQKLGCPPGAVACLSIASMAGTQELMASPGVRLILATGGPGMVKSAYTSGKPAIGVGAGNGPAYIHKTANVPQAVCHIVQSKTFDNGVVCASEQSVIVEQAMEQAVCQEMKRQGCHFLSQEDAGKVAACLFRASGSMNPKVVGKTALEVARFCAISVPPDTKVLVARETGVGKNHPYSQEKLCPVLGFFVEPGEDAVIRRCCEILHHEGHGHTFSFHGTDLAVIEKLALVIPVSRFLINTSAALGGIGATTNLFPALTLGCGAVGGSSSSNNIGPLDLINIRRVAWGVGKEEKPAPLDTELVDEVLSKLLKKLNLT